MRHEDSVYIGHMLEMAQKAAGKVRHITREQFDADEDLQLAVTHLIQVIGEAANQVSRAYQTGHPDIPWSDIIGMRHKVVHDYLNIDLDIVWDAARTDLPSLVAKLEKLCKG